VLEQRFAREPASDAGAAAVVPGVTAGGVEQKVERLARELETMQGTLAELKGIAAQRLGSLRAAQERLAALERTKDVVSTEQAFLEQFDTALDQRPKPPTPPQT
jgi:hypothetical protein